MSSDDRGLQPCEIANFDLLFKFRHELTPQKREQLQCLACVLTLHVGSFRLSQSVLDLIAADFGHPIQVIKNIFARVGCGVDVKTNKIVLTAPLKISSAVLSETPTKQSRIRGRARKRQRTM